jgi:hypothetical protein
MCQRRNGLITAQTHARIPRRWEKSHTRLGESSHRMGAAAGSPKEGLAGTLVAGISRRTMRDEGLWIFPHFFSNWGLRSGWGCWSGCGAKARRRL